MSETPYRSSDQQFPQHAIDHERSIGMRIQQLQSGLVNFHNILTRRLRWLILIVLLGMVGLLPQAAAAQNPPIYYTMTSPQFSDANNWHSDPSYWQTIQFPDINGDGHADVCGRGYAGIVCALTRGSGFDTATIWSSQFSDANGWKNDPSAWATIRFPDLNGDHKADVCGRGFNGIYCALSNGQAFDPGSYWTPQFRNADGWHTNPAYWQTIQFVDLNNDHKVDVCGRGIDGIICGFSSGQAFGPTALWSSQFSDANGWKNDPSAWATIRFPDLNGDHKADVCGRGFNGIYCALSNGQAFNPGSYWSALYSNVNSWHTDPSYWKTIQFADINGDGKDDVCGRGGLGLSCGVSNGTQFNHPGTVQVPDFSNLNGWNAERFYKTIRLVDVNHDGKADACGRGIDGILCAASTGSLSPSFSAIYLQTPAFGDGAGWAQADYYWGTVQPTNVNVGTGGLVWCGRAIAGVQCVYRLDL